VRNSKRRCREAGRRAGRWARSWPARPCRITQKAGVDGRLFGSVTNADIAEALTRLGLDVPKSQVRMPMARSRHVRAQTVSVALHTDVVVEITVSGGRDKD
jgi:ribosomal protein L9